MRDIYMSSYKTKPEMEKLDSPYTYCIIYLTSYNLTARMLKCCLIYMLTYNSLKTDYL